jgi:hypothetical protein
MRFQPPTSKKWKTIRSYGRAGKLNGDLWLIIARFETRTVARRNFAGCGEKNSSEFNALVGVAAEGIADEARLLVAGREFDSRRVQG